VAYVGEDEVVYGKWSLRLGFSFIRFASDGHLWTAKWWTEADKPGGAAGVWVDEGACY